VEEDMKKFIGLWIDHQKAIIVSFDGKAHKVTRVNSDVEKHTRMSGGSRSKVPYGPMDIADERKADRRHEQQLNLYYQGITNLLTDVDKIFIIGPGEAKTELAKHLEKTKLIDISHIAIEPADKMTENQIVAKIRKHFKI
jgi:hypothetical protein